MMLHSWAVLTVYTYIYIYIYIYIIIYSTALSIIMPYHKCVVITCSTNTRRALDSMIYVYYGRQNVQIHRRKKIHSPPTRSTKRH